MVTLTLLKLGKGVSSYSLWRCERQCQWGILLFFDPRKKKIIDPKKKKLAPEKFFFFWPPKKSFRLTIFFLVGVGGWSQKKHKIFAGQGPVSSYKPIAFKVGSLLLLSWVPSELSVVSVVTTFLLKWALFALPTE